MKKMMGRKRRRKRAKVRKVPERVRPASMWGNSFSETTSSTHVNDRVRPYK